MTNFENSDAQLAYEADVAARPTYDTGKARPCWHRLRPFERRAWGMRRVRHSAACDWLPIGESEYREPGGRFRAKRVSRSDPRSWALIERRGRRMIHRGRFETAQIAASASRRILV